MLYLNLTERLMGRDPKDSIEDALRVSRTLQIGVMLSCSYPWREFVMEIAPTDQLDSVLGRFDARVAQDREAYMRGYLTSPAPPRPSAAAETSRGIG